MSRPGAIFDLDKLNWMNGHYIRDITSRRAADALLDYWRSNPPDEIPELPDREQLMRIVPLIQERLKTLQDAAALTAFFFRPLVEYDGADLVQKGMDTERTRVALDMSLSALKTVESFDAESLEGVLRPLADELGVKAGQLFGSLRVRHHRGSAFPAPLRDHGDPGPRPLPGRRPRGGGAALTRRSTRAHRIP